VRLARAARQLGIRKLKLTGGEPLLRDDVVALVKKLAPYFEELSMTTNGTMLSQHAARLKNAGLARVNVSLDSLRPRTYACITARDLLRGVLAGVKRAVASGLLVKLNVVLLRGLNTNEVENIISFSAANRTILQLIELTASREGTAERVYQRYHYSLEPLEQWLHARAHRTKVRELHRRKKYFLPWDGAEVEVEVVRPMHNTQFCRNCTRLRVTADGLLKGCIFASRGYRLEPDDYEEAIRAKLVAATFSRAPYW
jgi:cyclic pyranopterin phosphate synthase